MADTVTIKKNRDGLYELKTEEVRKLLPRIIERRIPLRRRGRDGEYAFIPAKDFDHYLKSLEMTFFVDEEGLRALSGRKQTEDVRPLSNEPAPAVSYKDSMFQNMLDDSASMDLLERLQLVLSHNHRMRGYIDERRRFDPTLMKEVGNIFAEAMCVNKVSLMQNLESRVDPKHLQQIITGTVMLVDGLVKLMASGRASFRDLAALGHIQTGSVTLNHMNRMLIRFTSLLFFYNSYFQKYSNDVKRFRAHFNDRFYPYYNKKTQGSQKISLEIVFKGGIAPVLDRSVFNDFLVGGFFHDIGKLPEIHYHDGTEAFDRRKASRHVFDGYNMLVESGYVSNSAVAVALLHHDYYGSPKGYRQLDTFQSRFVDRRKDNRDTVFTHYFISYNVKDVGFGAAYSYFPVKMIEILDIFDAMTDAEKGYRKEPLTPDRALELIRKEHLDGDHLGVDPILFNIIVDFLYTSGIISAEATSVKIGY
jgi:hypothetical protein